jgi:hypothetical protein
VIYRPSHLAELAQGIRSLLARGPEGLVAIEPAPVFMTSAGVAVALTRLAEGRGGRYHLSVSRPDALLAQGAALTLVALLLDLLDVDVARARVSPSTNVTYASFELTSDEELALAGTSPPVFDDETARERLRRAMDARSRMISAPRAAATR